MPSKIRTRRIVSVTMQHQLYEELHARCEELDQPITVYVRGLIKQALKKEKG